MTDQPPKGQKLTRPGLASELVHDILKDKAEARAQGHVEEDPFARRRRRLRVTMLLLVPLFVGAVALNLTLAGRTPVVFTQAELDASARFRIFLAVQAVRAYRDSAGRWPSSLAAAGFPGDGLSYQLADTGFIINATSGGVLFTYRTGADLGYFRDAAQELMR